MKLSSQAREQRRRRRLFEARFKEVDLERSAEVSWGRAGRARHMSAWQPLCQPLSVAVSGAPAGVCGGRGPLTGVILARIVKSCTSLYTPRDSAQYDALIVTRNKKACGRRHGVYMILKTCAVVIPFPNAPRVSCRLVVLPVVNRECDIITSMESNVAANSSLALREAATWSGQCSSSPTTSAMSTCAPRLVGQAGVTRWPLGC